MTNIFLTSDSYISAFAEVFYNLLMRRKPVSYVDIICEADPNITKEYFAIKTTKDYSQISSVKKAVSLVCKELNERFPGSLVDNHKRKGKLFTYVGKVDDPFEEDRKYSRKQTIEDYVHFCKSTIGLLPPVWFPSFFSETSLLLEANNDIKTGNVYIASSYNVQLRNIELLPELYKYIIDCKVIEFEYTPFGKTATRVKLHPQFLKEYNSRWFLLGQTADSQHMVKVFPLDRITSSIEVIKDIDYLQAEKGFYIDYFKNIVGVTHNNEGKVYDIEIMTYTAYIHGLVKTKPFHSSQKETEDFMRHADGEYGKFSLHVEPTVELIGKIISLGADLEVVSPSEVRNQIKDVIEGLSARYVKKSEK